MAKITRIMTDLDKASKGVWIPFESGIELCIASTSNPGYRKARTRVLKKHSRQIRAKTFDADEIIDALKPAYAKHVLVGWKNIEDENGKQIKYSPEKALEFFNDPQLTSLFDFVNESAGEEDLFRTEELEAAAKNS